MPILIDLSHTIKNGMTTFKGLPAPLICDYWTFESSSDFYEVGTSFQISKIEMVANTGTYMDCPSHRYLKGKDLSFAKKVTADFLNMVKNKTKITVNSLTEDQVTTITSLSGVQEFPMRVKCATMVWHTFISAVDKNDQKL